MDVKFPVLDIVIVMEISILFEIPPVQDILNLITNEETPDLHIILLSETIANVLFLDPTLDTDSVWEVLTVHIYLHQNHVHDLSPHLKNLKNVYNQSLLKIMSATLTTY